MYFSICFIILYILLCNFCSFSISLRFQPLSLKFRSSNIFTKVSSLSLVNTKNFLPFQVNNELILTIDSLSNLGVGIGRKKLQDDANWVIMVPLAIPEEKVRVQIIKNYKTYSEAKLIEIIESSNNRVKPLCKYYNECDGCQYQHINIDYQRYWKQLQTKYLFHKIANITNININSIIGTNETYYYRTKISPHYDYNQNETRTTTTGAATTTTKKHLKLNDI